MEVCDVAVVGAGPAGTVAALGVADVDPGLRVLLLDRAEFPRDKSCGDGIAAQVLDVLREVGADDVVDGWTPLRRLALSTTRSGVERSMARPAWVVPRAVFDARLLTHARSAGAELVRHRARTIRVDRSAGEVVVDEAVRCRVLVGADGAHSVVRGAVGLAPARRRALAIRGYAPTPDTRRDSQVIAYGDSRRPSYAWSFDRGDGLSNVGYGELLGAGPAPSRAELLAQLERLLPGATEGATSWRGHHLPLSHWRWRVPDGPVLLAGDAAGLINPMTGEGIYYAVASGLEAGRAAARAVRAADPGRAGRLHRTAVRPLLAGHLRHTYVTSRLSGVQTVVEAGIRASAADQRVFDDLVEIGLGGGRITSRLVGGLAGSWRGPRSAPRGDTPPAPGPGTGRDHPTERNQPHADLVGARRAARAPLPAGRDHRRAGLGGDQRLDGTRGRAADAPVPQERRGRAPAPGDAAGGVRRPR